MDYASEARWEREQEREEEYRRYHQPPPDFCLTVDEYREYLQGIVTENELRQRHAACEAATNEPRYLDELGGDFEPMTEEEGESYGSEKDHDQG